MAAPLGNNNAGKSKEWRDQIKWALENYEGGKVAKGQALRAIATKLVEEAIDGDSKAREEIANRLDGKPVQSTELSGPEGGAIKITDPERPKLTKEEWLAKHHVGTTTGTTD